MTAVDTNVLIGLLTGDDRKQAAAARALFETEAIWIAKPVLLETNWVLGSLFGFNEDAVREALRKMLGLPNVQMEDEQAVAAALTLSSRGIDFADALHLYSKPPAAGFASFDAVFVRRAVRAGVKEARVLRA